MTNVHFIHNFGNFYTVFSDKECIHVELVEGKYTPTTKTTIKNTFDLQETSVDKSIKGWLHIVFMQATCGFYEYESDRQKAFDLIVEENPTVDEKYLILELMRISKNMATKNPILASKNVDAWLDSHRQMCSISTGLYFSIMPHYE